MLLGTLLKQAGLEMPDQKNAECEVRGICSDSRRVRAGDLFVAITGLSHDGYTHVGEAIQQGACFVVADREVSGVPHLVVDDPREALARLWDAWHGHPAASMKLIGITGTNGKTSCACMLYAILCEARLPCGMIGTLGCYCNGERIEASSDNELANMTTPDPEQLYRVLAQMRDGGVRFVVMEVTSHALTFSKVAPLFFERAVFTNLTPDHLDLHGDMESYFAEKRKLFDKTRAAVISCRSEYGVRLADSLSIPLFLLEESCLREVVYRGSEGVTFSLRTQKGGALALSVPVPGAFSIENSALAAMTALSLGVSGQAVQHALLSFKGVPGRMERVDDSTVGFSVFLDYAHTPDAMEKLLETVRGFRAAGERIVLLFGCGGDRDRSKRPVMGRIASRLADFLILTSDNCRSEDPKAILHDILRGVDKEKPFIVIPERKAAISYAVKNAKKGDIVVLAGKGHEEYEITGKVRLPFCEREIVRECICARVREDEDAD